MKKLAIIGATGMAEYFANAAKELGVETHCFAWAQGAKARESMDHFYDVSVMDVDTIVDMCREIGVDGVVATTELTIYPTAQVAHALDLVGNDVEVSQVITDKYRNRDAVRGVAGLNQPFYHCTTSLEEAQALNVAFPVIVKPTSEGGKRGISVAHNDEELRAALDYAQADARRSPAYLVEQYLDHGDEFSVESLSYNGEHYVVQVTKKDVGEPHRVELGHHMPANISAQTRQQIVDAVTGGLTAIGLTYGACHTEIKLMDGKVYLIEFNARPGGDAIPELIRLSTGLNYIGEVIKIALGEFVPPKLDELEHNYAEIFFVVQQTSNLKPIFDDAQNHEWCYRKVQVHDTLQLLEHNNVYNTNYFIYFSKTERAPFYNAC